MIIDIHTHLGNVLYPQGGALITERNVKRRSLEMDAIALAEEVLFRVPGGQEEEWNTFVGDIQDMIAEAARERLFTGTLENMRKSMDDAGITKSVCLPIPPYVTFDDLKKANELDPDVIPFSGVDYTRDYDIESALKDDVANGAKGMKLHPIIQKAPLTSKRTFEAVEAFSPHKLPVLFHCGVVSYYLKEEKEKNQVTEYGRIHYAKALVSAFPSVSFIAGHAGGFQAKELMDLLGKYKNVWVDITYQAPETIVELISVFGPERILYASDWPNGERMPTIRTVQEACKGDRSLEKLIFYENAAHLLKMPA